MAKAQSVTTLGESPEADRKRRMIRYSIAMTVRVICLIVGMFVQGWFMWVCFAGAIFLPYFAVILANDDQRAAIDAR
jgi:predicted tellurium resistance membrane protein TerC